MVLELIRLVSVFFRSSWSISNQFLWTTTALLSFKCKRKWFSSLSSEPLISLSYWLISNKTIFLIAFLSFRFFSYFVNSLVSVVCDFFWIDCLKTVRHYYPWLCFFFYFLFFNKALNWESDFSSVIINWLSSQDWIFKSANTVVIAGRILLCFCRYISRKLLRQALATKYPLTVFVLSKFIASECCAIFNSLNQLLQRFSHTYQFWFLENHSSLESAGR